jgi:peptidoglycan/LPS O-acetylase OafA/YrhL
MGIINLITIILLAIVYYVFVEMTRRKSSSRK